MIGWILKVVGIVLLIAVLLYLKKYSTWQKRAQKPEEKVLAGTSKDGEVKKSALLLYHDSAHGTTRAAAEWIAAYLQAKGYDVTMNHPSDKIAYDPQNFDLLVFGTPAYHGVAAEPLLKFMKENGFVHKTLLAFVTGYSLDDKRELEQIRGAMPKNNRFAGVKVHKDAEDTLKKFFARQV